MGSEGLHEPAELLGEQTIDRHRAFTSLIEELEAVDWYDQRVHATNDSSLADILAHNRDEEKEHACMTLEWLRRRDPALDRNLRTYLFTTEPVTEVEHETEAGAGSARAGRFARHRQPEGRRVMDHLYRELAPVSEAAWEQIESEAKGRLVTHLAARKLVDLVGPHGWSHSATDLGRVDEVASPSEGVAALRRRVLPLVELRADFAVSREELDDADRGADNIELPELDEAVRQIALAENSTVFHGYAAAGHARHHRGQLARTAHVRRGHGPVPHGGGPSRRRVAARRASAAPTDWPSARRSTPESSRRRSTAGSCSSTTCARFSTGRWCGRPASQGGVVLSLRGGDFVLDSGQDLSIGYRSHDGDVVRLYIEESFSFRVIEPDAAIASAAELSGAGLPAPQSCSADESSWARIRPSCAEVVGTRARAGSGGGVLRMASALLGDLLALARRLDHLGPAIGRVRPAAGQTERLEVVDDHGGVRGIDAELVGQLAHGHGAAGPPGGWP